MDNNDTHHATTLAQYHSVIRLCQSLFEKKTEDYGTAWRILRLPTFTDQIMIKAQRIRMIQTMRHQAVNEPVDADFIGIVNYSIMALMQMEWLDHQKMELNNQELIPLYKKIINTTLQLLGKKNHDYQEAWRAMRLTSLVDIILMKLLRIKRIEDNQGVTLISEGIAANYQDIINYAVFALIKLNVVR